MGEVNKENYVWWKHGVVYHLYVRSFKDSNNDGIGDLRGVIQRFDYLVQLGIKAIWLSTIYESPMKDYGYDIVNYRAIDPSYDTMEDFKENEKNAYNALKKSGRDFYKDVTSHFISSKQGTTQEKYSPDELIQIASRYDNEKDFFNGDKEAYGGAIKLGSQFFNNITNHMKYPEGIDLSPIISNALREWKNKYQN